MQLQESHGAVQPRKRVRPCLWPTPILENFMETGSRRGRCLKDRSLADSRQRPL